MQQQPLKGDKDPVPVDPHPPYMRHVMENIKLRNLLKVVNQQNQVSSSMKTTPHYTV